MLIVGYKNDGICRMDGNLVFRLCAQGEPLQNVYFKLSAPDVFRGSLKERCIFIPYIFPDSNLDFTIPYRCAHSFNRSEAEFQVTAEFSVNGEAHIWRGSFQREFEVRQSTVTQNIYNIHNETTVNGATNGFAYVDNGTTLPGQSEPEIPEDFGTFKQINGRCLRAESEQNVPLLVQIDSGKEFERGIKNQLNIHFSPCFHANCGRNFTLKKISGTLTAGGQARAFVLDHFSSTTCRIGDYSFTRSTAHIPVCFPPDVTQVELCQLTCAGEMNGEEFCYSMPENISCMFPVLKDVERTDTEDPGNLPMIADFTVQKNIAKILTATTVENTEFTLFLRALSVTDSAGQDTLLRKLGGTSVSELDFSVTASAFSVHYLTRFNYEIKEIREPEKVESDFARACRLFGTHGDGLNPGAAFELFRKEYEASPADRTLATYLGECYLLGCGTPRNESKGLDLIRRAADAGAADAMLNFAECCFAGVGMTADIELGKKYLLAAVDAGNPDAKCRLAEMYLNGNYFTENIPAAVKLYTEAAGNADADYALACIQYFGLAGERDAESAAATFERLAKKGHLYAKVMYARCHENELSPEQIAKICLQLPEGDSALHGLAYSMLGEAALCMNDLKHAAQYFCKGSACGNVKAIYQYAMCCLDGKGMPRNSRDGVELLMYASQRNFRPAMLELAECYLRGIGLYADYDAAFGILKDFIPLKDPRGDFLLGMCYYHGMGVEENERSGIAYFRRSAENGYTPAKEYLEEIL